MKVEIIGDDIFAGGEKIATLNAECKNTTLLEAFKHDFEDRFCYGMRILRK
jgi:hypothetical protein